jgi:phosphate/sulfate permease
MSFVEAINWIWVLLGILGTIMGVILGFMLPELSNNKKEQKRQQTIKVAVINELKIINDTLSNAEHVSYVRNGENLQLAIAGEKMPLITETYNAVKIDLASFLKPEALATIQRTYVEIQKLNERGRTALNCSAYTYYCSELEAVIKLINKALKQLH